MARKPACTSFGQALCQCWTPARSRVNATWRFASAENRDLFIANPVQYSPQYGGFCAWAVSRGYTADIDPEAWTIHEERLYLNYNSKFRKRWSKDIPGNVKKGDANWPGVLDKE